jgi:hypothetical protein
MEVDELDVAARLILADDEIEVTTSVKDSLVIPAINELRYAARHLALGLRETDLEARRAQLKSAAAHCARASLDAIEARALFALACGTAASRTHSSAVQSGREVTST